MFGLNQGALSAMLQNNPYGGVFPNQNPIQGGQPQNAQGGLPPIVPTITPPNPGVPPSGMFDQGFQGDFGSLISQMIQQQQFNPQAFAMAPNAFGKQSYAQQYQQPYQPNPGLFAGGLQ